MGNVKKEKKVRVKDLSVKKDVKGGMLACRNAGGTTPVLCDGSVKPGQANGIIAILIGL